ncbi:MAG: galactose mutarotase [Saprospiraceae bacterium]|nr:galactose mutarotase [Saprospiraceae bacterium]
MLSVKKELFGNHHERDVYLYTFRNINGNQIQITNYGGIVHSWICADKYGHYNDILLGCKDFDGYLKDHPYFGCITGRYANRIAFGKFSIDGHPFQLTTNLPPNHLHGGFQGLNKKIWNDEISSSSDSISLILTVKSPHLEEGYPGNLTVKVIYTYNIMNELKIEYFAESDRATPINLTNHCYFNLSGDQNADISDHMVRINAKKITITDKNLIPTGNFQAVKDSVFDFTNFRSIAFGLQSDDESIRQAKGYDHNFVLDSGDFYMPAAVAIHNKSGRRLTVFTDQPAIQLYTGNWLNNVDGKPGKYRDYAGFCLETQHFPDSPNHAHFPDTILRPSIEFYSKTIYKIDLTA